MVDLSFIMLLKFFHRKTTNQKKVKRKMTTWKKFSLKRFRQVYTCSRPTLTTVLS